MRTYLKAHVTLNAQKTLISAERPVQRFVRKTVLIAPQMHALHAAAGSFCTKASVGAVQVAPIQKAASALIVWQNARAAKMRSNALAVCMAICIMGCV